MSYNKKKTIAEIWLESHYPNKTLLTNFSMNLYDFPEFVRIHVMNNWCQNTNSRGGYWEKYCTNDVIKYSSTRTDSIRYNLF